MNQLDFSFMSPRLEPKKGTEGIQAGRGANTHQELGGASWQHIQVENTLFFTTTTPVASSEKGGLLLISISTPPPGRIKIKIRGPQEQELKMNKGAQALFSFQSP